jgi:hypothetical protein
MRIETNDAELAKSFSDGQITTTGCAWLTREARKALAWDYDAYCAFEDAYWDKANGAWSGDRIDFLLTSEPLARTVALTLFLQKSGFPESAANRVSESVVQALSQPSASATVPTEMEVVWTSPAPTAANTATPAVEVTLRGPMLEQTTLSRALGASAATADVTTVIRSACNYLVEQCNKDSGLRQSFLASDWAQGLASLDALRFVAQAGPAGSGSIDGSAMNRALVEVALMIYLDRRGFGELAGDAAERLADGWAGRTASSDSSRELASTNYTLKLGPTDEEPADLSLLHAGDSL